MWKKSVWSWKNSIEILVKLTCTLLIDMHTEEFLLITTEINNNDKTTCGL